MNAEPLGPPPPPAAPQRNWGRRRLLWLIAFALLLVLGVVSVIFLRGRNEDTAQASELFLEEQSSTGDDPFTQNDAQPLPGAIVPSPGVVPSSNASSASFLSPSVPPPAPTPSGVTAVQSVDGATPGLYGGTQDQSTCDRAQMARFLTANPDKANAWVAAQNHDPSLRWSGGTSLTASQIPAYLNELTPIRLLADTRVTNNGYVNGAPTPHQSVLQAGTAVLVDQYGVPRVRCACGNPLQPPVALSSPVFRDNPWPGYGTTVVVNQSATIVNDFTLINIYNGSTYTRPAGTDGTRDTPTTLNRWVTAADTPSARYFLAAAAGADGRLYAFGGLQQYAPSGPSSIRVTDTVESYDPAENLWRTEAPLPTPRCCLAAVGARNGDIYVIGGESESNLTYGGSKVPLDTVEVYSPDGGTWRSAASLSVPLGDARAVEGADGRIYAIGFGQSSEDVGGAETFEIYTTQTDTWKVGPPMPTPRSRPLLAAGRDGRIYVIGGSRGGGDTAIVEVYDPANNKWSQAASMPGPLNETTAVTGPDGRIYVPGGQDTYAGSPVNTVYVYTPDTNTWAKTTPLPIARYSQTAALGPDKRIYVIGGDTGSTEQRSGITTRVDVLTSGS